MSLKIAVRTLSHHVTWQLGTKMPETFPFVFVVGYPKSGTTWVCQLLADLLQLPFPRYSLLPVGCPAVVHGHERVWPSYRRCAYVLRDGRDVMASMYFYLARQIPDGPSPAVPRRLRRYFPDITDKHDTRANFPAFLRAQFEHPHAARVHWGRHVESALQNDRAGVARIRYEDLLDDGPGTLAAAAERITGEAPDPERVAATIAKFAFSRQAGRSSGEEDRSSFLRKGRAGDWVNHFTPEAAQIFDRYAGESLVAAGYEPDRSWVGRVGDGPAEP